MDPTIIAYIRQIPRNKRILFFVLAVFSAIVTVIPTYVLAEVPEPMVAVHVSELTQALETIPAVAPTPTGLGTTGYEWWVTDWRYSVMPDSLKEALRADGTPFVVVNDADIAAGHLIYPDGSPRYPILISLASEAVEDNEIGPLRDYVAGGGILFIGSSAFTRNPDGTTRGDFALADEMGLHMAQSTLQNWYENLHFSKVVEHPLVAGIPGGTISWRMPESSDEVPLGVSPNHFVHGYHDVFHVTASSGTTVIANGDQGPLLTTRPYGKGNFIYHGAMQPLIGHTVYDPAMYAYLIYRHAIEWAFEAASVPIVKLSPWRYDYNAAFVIRHDLENYQDLIRDIERSASFENAIGVKGDYYFCTGTLREEMPDKDVVVESIRRAVANYGATIGSHNGGLRNPANPFLVIGDFDYWHWGTDEALDTSPPGFASGRVYARESVSSSFNDIEGWMAGVDNGRTGCGSAGNCPRVWASPYCNGAREGSYQLLEELDAAILSKGTQKIGPFPHQTLSYEVPGKHYNHISLPESAWYVGSEVPGAIEWGHTTETIRTAVDFYHNLGGMVNLYGHITSDDTSLMGQYAKYCLSKPRMWTANAVEVADWWQARSNAVVIPSYEMIGGSLIAEAMIAGATDPGTAIEVAIPHEINQAGDLRVSIDGALADPADYRIVGNTIKIQVGSTTTNARVEYAVENPAPAITDLSPTIAAAGGAAFTLTVHGSGFVSGSEVRWNDESRSTTYVSATELTAAIPAGDIAAEGTASVTVLNPSPGGGGSNALTFSINSSLFTDDFSRSSGTNDPLSPWVVSIGNWSVADGVMQGAGDPMQYSYAYIPGTSEWTDYVIEGRIQMPTGSFGGGIGGRLDPSAGAHYGVWVYPEGSPGGSNLLKLWKFRSWTDLGAGVPMRQVSLPAVGTGWHTLRMSFDGDRILVYYDGNLMMDVTDDNYDSRPPYSSGGISSDWWTWSLPYTMMVDDISVVSSTQETPAPFVSSLSPPSAVAGGEAFTMTVQGSGFIAGSEVQWNGSSRSTTYVSATELTAAIPAEDIATEGTASVTVFNPAPGGGTSNALSFAISNPENPVPAITDLSPSSAASGGDAFTLTVQGSGFVAGSEVQWNGSSRSTTYVSATELTAAIPAEDIATEGAASVTVFNPAPGGGTSNAPTFTISNPENPAPVITGLSPASTAAGGATFTLTVNGSGFIDGSAVQWNGASRGTTYVSATELTAAIPAEDIATAGTASVTVFNPAPGGGTSDAQTFTIYTGLFSDDFTRSSGGTDPLLPWVASMGTWTVAGGVLQGSGNPMQYSYAHIPGTPQWTDYMIQGRIQIPAGAFGGGIGGRVDPATGAHYGAWVYPAGSPGGSNLLKLWKFRGWTDIGVGVPMRQVSLPAVGTGWHTLQMSFVGNRILVYYDGALMMDVTDNNYDSRPPYSSGGISADWWTWSLPYTITVDDISVVAE